MSSHYNPQGIEAPTPKVVPQTPNPKPLRASLNRLQGYHRRGPRAESLQVLLGRGAKEFGV